MKYRVTIQSNEKGKRYVSIIPEYDTTAVEDRIIKGRYEIYCDETIELVGCLPIGFPTGIQLTW